MLIADSTELQTVLRKYELTTGDVCDYHRYPIADNDTPLLSADRLEYTIGNSINYRICTIEDAKRFYSDLIIGTNEYVTSEHFRCRLLHRERVYKSCYFLLGTSRTRSLTAKLAQGWM